MPAAPRPASGPWSPASCSVVQRVQRPPRRRARTCASHAAAARPAEADQVEAPRRAQHAAWCASPRPPRRRARGRGGRARRTPRAAPRPTRVGAQRRRAPRWRRPSLRAWRRVRRGTVIGTRCSAERIVALVPAAGAAVPPVAERATRSRGSCPRSTTSCAADRVAQALGDAVDQPLQLGIGERVALAAALADRVVMVLAARVGGLEAGGAVDVEPVHEPQRGEDLERAVDAREARRCGRRRRAGGRGSPARSGSRAGARAARAPARARRRRGGRCGRARGARARPSRRGMLVRVRRHAGNRSANSCKREWFAVTSRPCPASPLLAAARRSLCRLPAAGRRRAGGGGRLDVVATTGQVADFAREVGGERVRVTGLLAPNADPHAFEIRPDDVKELAGADLVVRSGGDLDDWLDGAIDERRRRRAGSSLADHVDGSTATTRTGGRTRATRSRPPPIADALTEADPPARRLPRAPRRATPRASSGSTARSRAASPSPGAERTLVTTHDSLGYYARRYGLRVVGAVIPSRSTLAQPSAGEIAAAGRDDPARGRQGDLRRELGQPRRRGGDRARVRRARSGARCGPTRSVRRARTAPPTSTRSPRTPPRSSTASAAARSPAGPRPDARPLAPRTSSARCSRCCCSRCPPACSGAGSCCAGSRSSPTRSARRASPALVLASAWGIAPQLAALAAALGFGVAQERLARTRRLGADAATGLLLVGALARGGRARLGRLRVGRGGRHAAVRLADRAERARRVAHRAGRGRRRRARRRAAPALARDRLRARQRPRARAAPGAAPTGCCSPGIAAAAVVALDAVGALLVTVVLVVPAATVRLLTDRLGAAAARRDRARRGRGGRRGLAGRRAQRRRRARRWRCSAAACSRSWRRATALRARAVPA